MQKVYFLRMISYTNVWWNIGRMVTKTNQNLKVVFELYYIRTKILGRQIWEELTEAEAAAVTTATTSVPKNSYQWIINDIY